MEFLRQLDILKPHLHTDKRISVFGAGASGSYMVLLLGKIGMQHIDVYDPDIIEPHNIPNQLYFEEEHIGMDKIDALQKIVKTATGTEIVGHKVKVEGKIEVGNIVFLLTDTMESRKQIWKNCLKMRPSVDWVIETRMGSNNGRIYTICPSILSHITEWEKTLYDDDEAEVSACGGSISIAPTASLIASIAIWQLIKVLNKTPCENEIVISCDPWFMLTRSF